MAKKNKRAIDVLNKDDLIVIGEHQNGFWERLVLDNLAHQIVTAADRPVMIIKKQAIKVNP